MSDRKKIELRSEDINDILTRPPGWILRCGNTVILLVVLLVIIGSAVFKYPDRLKAPVVVTSENMPAQIVAKTTGRIQSVLKKEGDTVAVNELIAVIESATSYEDFRKLKEASVKFNECREADGNIILCEFPSNLQLGEMQGAYTQFLKSFKEYRNFFELNYHEKKIAIIKKQIETQKSIRQLSEKQLSIYKEKMDISEGIYKRDASLLDKKVLSQYDVEKSKNSHLEAKNDYENAQSGLNTIKLNILQAEQSLFDMELDRTEKINQLDRTLYGDFDNLQAEMREWEQKYLLVSPVAGKVSFTKFWQENQNISSADVVFTVIPLKEAKITGKIYLPINGAGKVSVGQKVNIKLDNYPYMEFGMVEVAVASISVVPTDVNQKKVYIVGVDFPDGLKTNYGTNLVFTEEMQGEAEIILENLSLLERVLFPVKHILKSRL